MYTIEILKQVDLHDSELCDFLLEAAEKVAELNNNIFDWREFDFNGYMRDNLFWLCRRNGRPVAVLLARHFTSVFDGKTRIVYQDLLYSKPGASRAAYLLMQQMIDFGRLFANHIFTMTAEKTNIKRRSLEKLGFKKTEELYILEC